MLAGALLGARGLVQVADGGCCCCCSLGRRGGRCLGSAWSPWSFGMVEVDWAVLLPWKSSRIE